MVSEPSIFIAGSAAHKAQNIVASWIMAQTF